MSILVLYWSVDVHPKTNVLIKEMLIPLKVSVKLCISRLF